jgi:hypothetical protein
MRLPDVPFMKRVFNLIKDIGLESKTLQYVMSQDNNLNNFNGKTLTNGQVEAANKSGDLDPFQTGVQGLDGSVTNMTRKIFDPFKDALKANFLDGWENLKHVDEWSTREFMRFASPGPRYQNEVRSKSRRRRV